MPTALRLAAALACAYLAVLVILWAFQDRFVYPAPQDHAPLTPGYQEVTLQTNDGLSLRAFYREAESGLPTALYFHGNGGTLSDASISNGAIAAAGIGVLLVEYRGYGGNPGQPSEQGFYSDGEAVMDWLRSAGIPPTKTVIIGNSIGGGVATEMAKRHDPAALILIAPFTSLPEAASVNLWWLPVELLMRDRFDNRSKLPLLDNPVLIQHGTADTLIPPALGRELAASSPQSEFQPFDGSRHDLSFERRSQVARRDWILSLNLEQ